MTRRYLWLLAALLVAALALAAFARRPHRASTPIAATPAAPQVAIELVASDGRITPPNSVVAKDHLVRLAVTNATARPLRFALAGYEDRVSVEAIARGATLRVEFLADRPGEAFAWLLDGEPAGTLTVSGSHLQEGHR